MRRTKNIAVVMVTVISMLLTSIPMISFASTELDGTTMEKAIVLTLGEISNECLTGDDGIYFKFCPNEDGQYDVILSGEFNGYSFGTYDLNDGTDLYSVDDGNEEGTEFYSFYLESGHEYGIHFDPGQLVNVQCLVKKREVEPSGKWYDIEKYREGRTYRNVTGCFINETSSAIQFNIDLCRDGNVVDTDGVTPREHTASYTVGSGTGKTYNVSMCLGKYEKTVVTYATPDDKSSPVVGVSYIFNVVDDSLIEMMGRKPGDVIEDTIADLYNNSDKTINVNYAITVTDPIAGNIKRQRRVSINPGYSEYIENPTESAVVIDTINKVEKDATTVELSIVGHVQIADVDKSILTEIGRDYSQFRYGVNNAVGESFSINLANTQADANRGYDNIIYDIEESIAEEIFGINKNYDQKYSHSYIAIEALYLDRTKNEQYRYFADYSDDNEERTIAWYRCKSDGQECLTLDDETDSSIIEKTTLEEMFNDSVYVATIFHFDAYAKQASQYYDYRKTIQNAENADLLELNISLDKNVDQDILNFIKKQNEQPKRVDVSGIDAIKIGPALNPRELLEKFEIQSLLKELNKPGVTINESYAGDSYLDECGGHASSARQLIYNGVVYPGLHSTVIVRHLLFTDAKNKQDALADVQKKIESNFGDAVTIRALEPGEVLDYIDKADYLELTKDRIKATYFTVYGESYYSDENATTKDAYVSSGYLSWNGLEEYNVIKLGKTLDYSGKYWDEEPAYNEEALQPYLITKKGTDGVTRNAIFFIAYREGSQPGGKSLPTIVSEVPTPSDTVAYGGGLYSVSLIGGKATSNGTEVLGTFEWTDVNIPEDAKFGIVLCEAIFHPYDSDRYQSSTCMVPVNYVKGEPGLSWKPFPKDLIYNGENQELVQKVTVNGGVILYSMDKGGPFSESIPQAKEIGEYTIYYKIVGDENHTDSAVFKLQGARIRTSEYLTKAPEGVDLVYNGKPQDLVIPGTVSKGKIVYGNSDGTETIPQQTNVGVYAVVYYVVDETGISREHGQIISSISRGTPTFIVEPKARDLVYTGEPQELLTPGETDFGEIKYVKISGPGNEKDAYSDDGDDTVIRIPRGTEVGTYKLKYYITGTQNYSSVSGIITTTIKPAPEDDEPSPGDDPGTGGGGGAITPAVPKAIEIDASGNVVANISSYTTVSGSVASTVITADTASDIAKNIKKNKTAKVKLDATVSDSVTKTELSIPMLLANAVNTNGASVEIATNVGSIVLDKQTIKGIAKEDADSFTIAIVKNENFSDTQAIFDITLETVKDGKATAISKLQGTAQVVAPLPSGLEAKEACGLYLNGKLAEKVTTKVDGKNVVLTVKHFSTYGIMSNAEADKLFKKSAEATTMGKLTLKTYKGGKIKTSWKNGTGNTANITKYQVYYKQSGKKAKYTTTASKSKTISKLKKGKTYIVKARAYIKINGKTYKSKWSSAKKIRCK